MKQVSIILFVGTARELLQLTQDIKNDPSADILLASMIPQ